MGFLKVTRETWQILVQEMPDKVVSWTSSEGCYTVQEYFNDPLYYRLLHDQSAVSHVVLSLTWLGYISMLRCNLTLTATLAFSWNRKRLNEQ